jgi:long-subunit fatty acid transport protein
MNKLFTLVLFLTFSQTFSQNKNDGSDFWDNVRFGGGINLNFGNNITTIGVAPSAIYNFNDYFSAGLGANYIYSKNKLFDSALNVYGGSLIALYNPIEDIQLSTEYEKLFLNQSGFESSDIDALYLGAGYSIGRNVTIGLRYDVLYKENKSVYSSAITPVFRVYF